MMGARGSGFGGVLRALALSAVALGGVATPASAETDLNVVTSIKPVHSLVASVMKGVGEPRLIVDGAGSPHGYSLKPSQAEALQNAEAVFWIGHQLEAFLEKPIGTLSQKALVVEFMDAEELTKLKIREGGSFEGHEHDDDHHDSAEKHDNDGHDDHAKAQGHEEGHDEDHGDEHDVVDAHIWLDPLNAKAMVEIISATLVAADPKNAAAYKANTQAFVVRLEALMKEVQATIAPVKGRGYIVFHDAYHYFEKRFGLEASGAISINPEVTPGAARIAEIQKRIRELGVTCVFAEPQFEPRLVKVVTEGAKAKSGVLDPLGAGLTEGPELYFDLIRNLSRSYAECLSDAT